MKTIRFSLLVTKVHQSDRVMLKLVVLGTNLTNGIKSYIMGRRLIFMVGRDLDQVPMRPFMIAYLKPYQNVQLMLVYSQ